MTRFFLSRLLLLTICCFCILQSFAQARFPERKIRSGNEIQLALEKLGTVGSVLFIAAHPDDENTRMISWLANERKVRTGYLSLTRGDGGQNLIGNEKGEELGLIRSQELLEARRRDGAEQFFTRALDFGYSKNPEETFEIWGKDRILADVVWVIRKFRPDVIISRFPTTGEGGHGHHTASAILTNEAFTLAADPKAFPEQLKYVKPWQARRVLWNSFSWNRKPGEVFPGEIAVQVGGYNALLGKSYGELAAEARSMHRCQGFGTRLVRGEVIEYVKNVLGDSITEDIFENINLGWSRIPGGEKITAELMSILGNFRPGRPQLSITALLSLRATLDKIPDEHWRAIKLKELDEIILASTGFYAEANTTMTSVSPGQEIELSLEAINRSPVKMRLDKISIAGVKDTVPNLFLMEDKPFNVKTKITLPAGYPISQPLWLTKPAEKGVYPPADELSVDQPENEPPVKVIFMLTIGGQSFTISKPLWNKVIDPSVGEIYQPLAVSPPVVFELPKIARVFPNNESRVLKFAVKNISGATKSTINLKIPAGWKADWTTKTLDFAQAGEVKSMEVLLTPATGKDNRALLTFEAVVNGNTYTYQRRDIEYPHIYRQTWYPQSVVTLQRIDLQNSKSIIGYIPGAGDDIAECLSQLGYTVENLDNEELLTGDLGRYKAIISGIRVYNTNDKMGLFHQNLVNYIKNGGNYIVQYNTNSFIGSVNVPVGPVEFTIGRDRVTREEASVTFIEPGSPVLNTPNKITSADFDGWVQERGLYFASKWDSAYTPLFEMNDPGEKPLQGSTISGQFEKGHFFYTGLSFFRQLPAGIPGAYRLLVNFIEQEIKF